MALSPASSRGGGFAQPAGWTVDTASDLHIKPSSDFDTILQVTQPTGGGFSDMLDLGTVAKLLFAVDYRGAVGINTNGDVTPLGITASAINTSDLVQLTGHAGSLVFKVSDAGLVTAVGSAMNPMASGALPTAAFVSATARQLSTTRDVFLCVPFTGDATNNAATCKVEVSPDNVTFSTLNTVSIAAALNLTGAIDLSIEAWVPAAWYVKLTATHGALGTGTYY